MPSGGARARSGPAPDPNALRRGRDTGEWKTLPATGRTGRPPKWPLPTRPSKSELALWKQEWKRPQAIEWEANHQSIEVALYVRAVAHLEEGEDVKAADRTVVLRMLDSLGISMPGMQRNRWRIVAADAGAAPAAPARESSRDRLRVVSGGGS